jgi:basic membrane protein A
MGKYLLLSVTVLAFVFACAGETRAAEAAKPRFIVTLPGMLGDKSYNDSCKAGIDKAVAEFGVEVKILQAATPADFESNNLAAAEGGYDLVIILSGQQKQAASKVIPEYPDQKFAIIDFSLPDNPKNVYSTLFAPNEGSFLAGAAAAMFTTQTQIDGVNPEKIVGWISGIETPLINDFYGGFKQGVAYIDPEVRILQAFAGSFTDPLKGKELALSQYEQGADIIMNVASATGIGILDAAAEQKKFAIGVDLNQDDLKPGYILTSMLKNVDMAAYLFIESIVKGTYEGGGRLYLDIAKGGVGLTDFSTFRGVWKDKFPQKIVERCQELAREIAAGKIRVDEFPGVR